MFLLKCGASRLPHLWSLVDLFNTDLGLNYREILVREFQGFEECGTTYYLLLFPDLIYSNLARTQLLVNLHIKACLSLHLKTRSSHLHGSAETKAAAGNTEREMSRDHRTRDEPNKTFWTTTASVSISSRLDLVVLLDLDGQRRENWGWLSANMLHLKQTQCTGHPHRSGGQSWESLIHSLLYVSSLYKASATFKED